LFSENYFGFLLLVVWFDGHGEERRGGKEIFVTFAEFKI